MGLTGWLARRERETIAYFVEENRFLRQWLGGRLRFTDADRRRLAVRAHRVGRTALREVATIATPDTLLRWHREPYMGHSESVGSHKGPSVDLEGAFIRPVVYRLRFRGGSPFPTKDLRRSRHRHAVASDCAAVAFGCVSSSRRSTAARFPPALGPTRCGRARGVTCVRPPWRKPEPPSSREAVIVAHVLQ
jgi:hypothetical protein